MICFIDSQIFTIFVTQCSITVFSGRIKRESGVNPGQSRCCKLHNVPDNFFATVYFEREGVRITEVSQKTCFASYFISFEERLLNRMNLYSYLFYTSCCFKYDL